MYGEKHFDKHVFNVPDVFLVRYVRREPLLKSGLNRSDLIQLSHHTGDT